MSQTMLAWELGNSCEIGIDGYIRVPVADVQYRNFCL